MNVSKYSKYVFVSIFILLLLLAYKVIEPYMVSIVTSFILAILVFPLYNWLKKKTGRDITSAFIVILVILLVVSVPLVFLLQTLWGEANETLNYIKDEFSNEGVFELTCEGNANLFCESYNWVRQTFPDINMKSVLIDNIDFVKDKVGDALRTIKDEVLQFVISLYILFFLLVDGHKLLRFAKSALELKPSYEKHIEKTLRESINGVVYGNILTALIQGFLASMGYWLIGGMKSAILLGLFTAFFALIPAVGTAFVWFPAGIFVMIQGWALSSNSQVLRGVLLLLYGGLVISTIDNIVKPKLIGARAKIHPAIVLIGVLGGLKLIGFIGVIVGPLILVLFITFIKLLMLERRSL